MEWHLWPVPTKHQLAMWVNLAVKYGRQASPLKPEIEATNSGKKRCELKSAFQNLPGRKGRINGILKLGFAAQKHDGEGTREQRIDGRADHAADAVR